VFTPAGRRLRSRHAISCSNATTFRDALLNSTPIQVIGRGCCDPPLVDQHRAGGLSSKIGYRSAPRMAH